MNSVFSAFKSSKNETKYKFSAKKISETSSYENLKHIREIGSSSKMSDLIDDLGDEATTTANIETLKFSATTKTAPSPSSSSISSAASSPLQSPNDEYKNGMMAWCDNGSDMVDHIGSIVNNDCTLSTTPTTKSISASESNLYSEHNGSSSNRSNSNSSSKCGGGMNDETLRHLSSSPPCSSLENLSAKPSMVVVPKANFSSEGDILSSCSNDHSNHHHNHSANSSSVACSLNEKTSNSSCSTIPNYKPIIKASNRSSDTNLVANKQQVNRLQKRLSLSGVGNGSMPSVHGRPTSANGQRDTVKKTRLSTHQRNLSLDFR